MGEAYDFVIVGAGAAGCALANRLSADRSISVALVEAGDSDDREAIRVPRQYFTLWGTDVDWGHVSTPQAGTAGRRHLMPRGRVLGGTTSINGMVYLRGAQTDYDAWATAGCSGWEWAQVRAAFEELEQWLQPAVLEPHHPLSAAVIEAAVQAGFPRNPSFDSGKLDGVGYNRTTIVNGERHNAYRAFVTSVHDRQNLHILPNSPVVRLAMDGTAVQGIVVRRNGREETIAAGEVILSAGAFDSPRLLMLSGIGPAAELEQFGIKVRTDLPVGKNFVDHLLIGMVFTSRQPISDLHAYCTEGCIFARSAPDRHDCDLEISFAKEPGFPPDPTDPTPRFTIIPGITKPKSHGAVRLTAADPGVPLSIDPNYFTHADDMAAMIRAVRITREVSRQAGLAEWNAGEHAPGPRIESDAEIARWVAEGVGTWFHPVGTCRMGTGTDAVVDPTLRVHDLAGLRVADASIMPEIVGVNTQAASMMIGWKAGGFALA